MNTYTNLDKGFISYFTLIIILKFAQVKLTLTTLKQWIAQKHCEHLHCRAAVTIILELHLPKPNLHMYSPWIPLFFVSIHVTVLHLSDKLKHTVFFWLAYYTLHKLFMTHGIQCAHPWLHVSLTLLDTCGKAPVLFILQKLLPWLPSLTSYCELRLTILSSYSLVLLNMCPEIELLGHIVIGFFF